MTTERSFLYVPATRIDRVAKAARTGAHVVIVDLEDAVAAADKPAARDALAAAGHMLRGLCDEAGCRLFVRFNARSTPWFDDDLALCAALPLHGLVVPKPDDPEALAQLAHRLPGRELHLLVESAAGFDRLAALARVEGVARLMLGAVDLMLDLGVEDDGEPLHALRTRLVLQSRLAGLPAPVDGVCTDLADGAALAREIDRARRFGFGAKLCVHPSQVEPIHRGFMPSEQAIRWARRVCEAAGGAQGAAMAVDGMLIDVPVLERARRVLAAAGA